MQVEDQEQLIPLNYIHISSTGNAFDFGDLTQARRFAAACNNTTRSIFVGGDQPSAQKTIDYVTIANNGNAQDFGELLNDTSSGSGAAQSPTRAVYGGGDGDSTLKMQYITQATLGNAKLFGDLQYRGDICKIMFQCN